MSKVQPHLLKIRRADVDKMLSPSPSYNFKINRALHYSFDFDVEEILEYMIAIINQRYKEFTDY